MEFGEIGYGVVGWIYVDSVQGQAFVNNVITSRILIESFKKCSIPWI
jgi:hypothetical protein